MEDWVKIKEGDRMHVAFDAKEGNFLYNMLKENLPELEMNVANGREVKE